MPDPLPAARQPASVFGAGLSRIAGRALPGGQAPAARLAALVLAAALAAGLPCGVLHAQTVQAEGQGAPVHQVVRIGDDDSAAPQSATVHDLIQVSDDDGLSVAGLEVDDPRGPTSAPADGDEDGFVEVLPDEPAAPLPGGGAVGPLSVQDGVLGGPPAAGARTVEPANPPPAPLAAVPRRIARAVPVVVELFTSQGCSSCPPADAMLAELAGDDSVLPLAWHVDYWDYLGWRDDFGQPDHSARQEAYAAARRERGIFTPQLIVDGEETLETLRPADLMAMVGAHRARPATIAVVVRPQGTHDIVELTPRGRVPGGAALVLVRYAPQRAVEVRAGENRGRVLTYTNVVLDSEIIRRWTATAPLRLKVKPRAGADGGFPEDTRHAILIQQILPPPRLGPILAAIRLD